MNGLESYVYDLRYCMTDERLARKFDPANKTKLETAVNDAISWLAQPQERSKEECEEKQKELEGIAKSVESTPHGRGHADDIVIA